MAVTCHAGFGPAGPDRRQENTQSRDRARYVYTLSFSPFKHAPFPRDRGAAAVSGRPTACARAIGLRDRAASRPGGRRRAGAGPTCVPARLCACWQAAARAGRSRASRKDPFRDRNPGLQLGEEEGEVSGRGKWNTLLSLLATTNYSLNELNVPRSMGYTTDTHLTAT